MKVKGLLQVLSITAMVIFSIHEEFERSNVSLIIMLLCTILINQELQKNETKN